MLKTFFPSTQPASTPPRIRPFVPVRATGCYRVDLIVHGVNHWPLSTWQAMDICRTTFAHVALIGERTVGFVTWAYGRGEDADALHLVKLAVDPEHRHKRIGTMLLNDLIDSKILDPSTPYMRLVHSIPEPSARDRKTLDGCRWLAKRGFRSYADGEWWRFVFGPDELLGRWNCPENVP